MVSVVVGVVFLIIAVVVGYVLASNSLEGKRNRVEQSWSNIDTYLQKRFDEMDQLLVQLGAAYSHESDVYIKIAEARSGIATASTPGEKIQAVNNVSSLMAIPGLRAESYPELTTLKQLAMFTMESTSGNERDILAARKVYNRNVTAYNNALDMWPTSVIAKQKGMMKDEFPYWKLENPEARQRPNVQDSLRKGFNTMSGN